MDNGKITPEAQRAPKSMLDAIQISIREEEHFYCYRDEILSDICKRLNEAIHVLSNCIIELVSNSKFSKK